MKKYHINFANEKYFKSQDLCSRSAEYFGFEYTKSFRPHDIDSNFYNKNEKILKQSKGYGYWIWKSYFLKKMLNDISEGDLLVYSDSGSFYINPVEPLIDLIKKDNHGVLSFELNGLFEKEYTKRDTFKIMNLDESKYTDSSQREATYIWILKNNFTINLIDEFYEYCQNEHAITDLPSINLNYKEFKEHRHDQSIWSLLCKKYSIAPHRLISQHGAHLIGKYPDDKYGFITNHHRGYINI